MTNSDSNINNISKKPDFSVLKGNLGLSSVLFLILILFLFLTGIILGLLLRSSDDYQYLVKYNNINPAAKNIVSNVDKKKYKKTDKLSIKKYNNLFIIDRLLAAEVAKQLVIEKENKDKDDKEKDFKKTNLNPALSWIKNAKPVVTENLKPYLVSIVIDDMGINYLNTKEIVDSFSGIPLTLSYLTYSPSLKEQMADAGKKGFETMMHIAMEAKSDAYDAGPEVLTTDNSESENLKNLREYLHKGAGFVGFNNHMGSKFTEDLSLMNAVLSEAKKQGLLFLDSLTSSKSKGEKSAKINDIPFIKRDIFLDYKPGRDTVFKQLVKLEKKAKEKGYAVAIGHPRDDTIEALKIWVKSLDNKELSIVPISYLVKQIEEKKEIKKEIIDNSN